MVESLVFYCLKSEIILKLAFITVAKLNFPVLVFCHWKSLYEESVMSSESDSEFFDAEDSTPVRTIRSQAHFEEPVSQVVCPPNPAKEETLSAFNDNCHAVRFPALRDTEEDLKEAERKVKENEKRRKKVEELRKRMLNDEDEVLEVPSDQSSLASSLEGVYPTSVSINPLKDKTGTNSAESQSMLSLGKVGFILGEKDGLSINSREHDTLSNDTKYSISETESLCDLNSDAYSKTENLLKCAEPDVVASTKCDRSGDAHPLPVAPPRRRRKKKAVPPSQPTEYHQPSNAEILTQTHLKEDLKELECSLDLHSATRGQYVVKPQDREQDRAEGPECINLAHLATELKVDVSGHSPRIVHRSSESEGDIKKESNTQPYIVRTRSDSGRPLTDQEILEQVSVINLDTGEQIPLSLAEERLPKCLNPLSLHIMRITSEYVSNSTLDKDRESDEDNADARKLEATDAHSVWKKARDLRKVIRGNMEKTVNQLKSVANQVYNTRHSEDDASEVEVLSDVRSSIKIKVSSSHKRPSEFDRIQVVQELSGEHTGAIWTMKFSSCGKLLATAGQDHDLRIWVLRDSFNYFDDMRQKYNTEGKSSPTPSQENVPSQASNTGDKMPEADTDNDKGPFMSKPFCRYKGHTAELLDVSWSKNYFILSSSMDKTVRLWHISRQECLCCFQHIDFVTAIAFHPRDDRFFLSGSLDGKLRLWNIPDKKVTLWNELGGQTKLITAVNFCQKGKIAVVGSYDGRCIFYNTEQLKYYTQIHVRSTRGKNAQGRKVSGIEAMLAEDKILVTSNDSRIRLYDLQDLSLSCKYKGYVNLSSQIKASFSHDGKYIISGSENQSIYIWKTSHDYAKFSSVRRDRNDYWEAIKAHNAVVTSAVFSPKPPNPSLVLKQLEQEDDEQDKSSASVVGSPSCYLIVSADFSGIIKVFLLRSKNGSSSLSSYAN